MSSAYDAQAIARSGIESYFPLSETSGVPTDRVGSNVLTAVGSPGPVLNSTPLTNDGEASVALSATGQFTCSTALIADLTADWTLVFVVELNVPGSTGDWFPVLLGGALTPPFYTLYNNGSSWRFDKNPGGDVDIANLAGTNVSIHVALQVKPSAGTARLFINGAYAGVDSTATTFDNSNPGFHFALDSGNFVGKLAKVAGYGRALSDAEIGDDYVAAQSPPISAYDEYVVATPTAENYFPLSDFLGTPKPLIGTLSTTFNGAPTIGGASITGDGEATLGLSANGQCLEFNGPLISDLTSDWSIGFVGIITNPTSSQRILNLKGTDLSATIWASGGLFAIQYNAGAYRVSSASVPTDMLRHFYFFRYHAAGPTFDWMVDGVVVATMTYSDILFSNAPGAGSSQFTADDYSTLGSFSKLQPYASALSDAAVMASYEYAFSGSPPPPPSTRRRVHRPMLFLS